MTPICVHCGCPIDAGRYPVHLDGSARHRMRCGQESGLKYGYNAHAVGTSCEDPCLGEILPDPHLHPEVYA